MDQIRNIPNYRNFRELYDTFSRDLTVTAREAGDADFDVLIACAFNYEAHATEFNKLGHIPVLKARMNAIFTWPAY